MKVIKYTVGVDISKLTLDFSLCQDGVQIEHWCIDNNTPNINKMLKELTSNGVNTNNSWFCAEHTGLLGNKLRECLEEHGLIYSMVPAIEIIKSIGLTRGKTDKVDAFRIAEYAYRFSDKLRPSKLPEKYLMRLSRLYTFRKQRVKRSTQLKNQIKQLENEWECAPKDYMLKVARKELKDVRKIISEIERQLEELIASIPEAKKNYSLARSVLGVGPLTACYLLICTDNFSLFHSARKFASYSGLAPFEHSSGTSIKGRTKTSHLRDKEIKTLLLNGVNAMISRDNELSRYYFKKVEEGKHKKSVKNAVAYKMVTRVFAAIKRQTPYVATYADNF